jgi:predicted ATPase
LVGREEELGVLQRRWAQAKAGVGQVVLLSGEPGIGKSRFVQELKEHVSAEGATRIEFRCSLTPDPQAEAEACFHKAIEIAQRRQAKSLELRATVSLARLWQQQGKYSAAHNMLSEIYGWFTEGFDTKDWQEAKALLEELT